jgi:acetyl esterase
MTRRTSMSKYNIHNDLKKYENTKLPLSPLLLPLINIFLTKSANKIKPNEGVSETKEKIAGYQNGLIELTIYAPKDIGGNAPCLIYLHGGAFALKAAPYHKNLVCKYALKTPCKVIFVDYRLAPKYAFPVGVEDCYAAFEWVCKNVEVLGIDKNRIAVGGDSAGSALAAAVSIMARDRKATGICFQMLIYPVTDARQITESIKNYIDTPMWNSKLNKKMWDLYLRNGVHSDRGYASPMEAASLKDLPDSYIEVSEFDCLRDEGINFAEALCKNGINVELFETTGTVHGFEIAENSEIVNQSVAKRIAALKKAFKNSEEL